jgi:hypothetical protein
MAVDVYISRGKETGGLCYMLCHLFAECGSKYLTWRSLEQERQNPFV